MSSLSRPTDRIQYVLNRILALGFLILLASAVSAGVDVYSAEVGHPSDTAVVRASTTDEIRERFYDGVELRREMGRDETFYSIDKARELVGFAPEHSWRDVLPDPAAS